MAISRFSPIPIPFVRKLMLFGLFAWFTLSVRAQSNTFLPVYQVVQAGATGTQATNLANALNIPPSLITVSNGLVSFIDPTNYLFVPTIPVTNSSAVSNLVVATVNKYPAIPITAEAIDFNALSNLMVLDDSNALSPADNALDLAGLLPQFGTPAVHHVELTAFYTNDSLTVISNSLPLDTEVKYEFADPSGYPIMGPGAQVQVNYGSAGNVTRLLYSANQMTLGTNVVELIPVNQASNDLASLFPPNAQINLQVVYWCPPYSPIPPCSDCPPPVWNPTNIIPWYLCTVTLNVTNPLGVVSPLNLLTQMIPATADTNYVPSANLSVAATGSNVVASVSVTGGTPPYSYSWAGSDSTASTNVGPSISYTPQIRVGTPTVAILYSSGSVIVAWPYPSEGFILESTADLAQPTWTPVTNAMETSTGVNSVSISPTDGSQFFRLRLASPTLSVSETVMLTVTDANGVTAQVSQTVAAQALPMQATQDPAIDYGCESPYDPGLGNNDRVNWQKGMSLSSTWTSGGGSQRFIWAGASSWPGDFIEPVTPGVTPSAPWIFGDADCGNAGVNSADIVLYIGHGNPNNITFIINGDARSIVGPCQPPPYVNPLSCTLWEPYMSRVGMQVSCLANSGYVNYVGPHFNGSWRNSGPTSNDTLYWMSMLACEVLQKYDGSGIPAWTRWGPAFNGVHLMTGFASNAGVATGFPYHYAYNMLHTPNFLGIFKTGNPMTIEQAWFDAADSCSTGKAAVLGAIGPNGVWNNNDHYWGKGSVGPSFPQSQIYGWWYTVQN